MSGHSKWATIHRQKEVNDSKKGQVFTKLTNAIIVAVRLSGGITDPDSNFKLRMAMEKARAVNMPKDNIERAIKKGAGAGEGAQWTEVTYEGYGPAGIAVLVEVITDNKNRTGSLIKNIFERAGGNLAGPGAVMFQFQKSGLMTVDKKANPTEQVLVIMDLGVDDVEEAIDAIEVYCQPERTEEVKKTLEAGGFRVTRTEVVYRPKSLIKIDDSAKADKVLKFMESLESSDDVQKVFANFDIPDEILEKISSK